MFQKGNPGGGRPKGSTNKITKTVKEALKIAFDDLQKDEKANLFAWGKDNPTEFYKIASKLLPTEINQTIQELPPIFSDDDIPKK